jgi:hypothetical protein
VNADRTEPYDLGDGYGHMALVVDDLDADLKRLRTPGIEPQRETFAPGDGLSTESGSSSIPTATVLGRRPRGRRCPGLEPSSASGCVIDEAEIIYWGRMPCLPGLRAHASGANPPVSQPHP